MLRNPKYIYGPVDRMVSPNINLGDYLLKCIWEHGNNVALTNGATDEKITYRQMAQNAMALAISLKRMGVRKGDVVAICSENRNEFWSTAIGVLCTGAVVTSANIAYTNDELKHVMGISKPKYVFVSPFAFKMHAHNYRSLSHIKKIIVYGDHTPRGTIAFNTLVESPINLEDFETVDVMGQSDTAFILYSSGTTGLPKGVMLTHLGVITACTSSVDMPPVTPLTITPWYHSLGLVSTLTSFAKGASVVYLSKFEVELYLKTIEKYKVTQLTTVPPILVALCKSDLKYDVSSVLFIGCGAAPLYKETADAAYARFPNALALLQGYGLTEATLAVTLNFNPEKVASVGLVTSHTVVKVVNPETRELLGPNQQGEICVKGVMMMKGYIGKDRKDDFDEEGFFRTGDIGYYDEEYYFYIVDRLKELIKYKAHQVPPAEIEAVLLKHEGIKDAGVVGIPHPSAGEVPLAFVVTQSGVTLTEKEIQDFVAERLSNPKHLRGGVRFLNEIPKNQTGKILRKELRRIAKMKKSKL